MNKLCKLLGKDKFVGNFDIQSRVIKLHMYSLKSSLNWENWEDTRGETNQPFQWIGFK